MNSPAMTLLASDEESDLTGRSIEEGERVGGGEGQQQRRRRPWSCSLEGCRKSKRLLVGSVFIALMFDSILLTAVVPVLPSYLHELSSSDKVKNKSPAMPPTWSHDAFDLLRTGSGENQTIGRLNHDQLLEEWLDRTPVNLSDLWTDWELALNNWTYLPNLTDFYEEDYDLSSSSSSTSSSSSSSSSSSPGGKGVFNYQREAPLVGWLFASKAIVQLIVNPFVGSFINRFGHGTMTMIFGVVVLLTSSLLYALGETYAVLFAGRAIHGLGASCIAIAGMSLLAQTYEEDSERSRVMGIALGGFSLGVLLGYPYGGFMYEFVSKSALFLILAALQTVFIGVMTCLMPSPPEQNKGVNAYGEASLLVLLRDPYILLAAGAVLFPEMSMALVEPTLPPWMMDTMHPKHWQIGTVFVPDSFGFFLGCNLFGVIAFKIGRWIVGIFCLILMAVSLFCIPFATAVTHLIVPHFGFGLALGAIDAAMFPLVAHLVDTRHVAVYGAVYAIVQISVSVGFAVGPVVGGALVKQIGFTWLLRGMALLNLLFAPFCIFLRNPPSKEENTAILMRENGSKQSPDYYTSEAEGFSYKPINED